MRNRRFLLLSAVLVTVNVALWLTPAGLALRQVAVQQLFGKSLMRAEVVLNNGQDWRVDRGTIASVTPAQITLKEADGRLQQIAISPSATSVVFAGRALSLTALAPRWRVLVTWPANGTADLVKVEKRVSGNGLGNGHGRGRK